MDTFIAACEEVGQSVLTLILCPESKFEQVENLSNVPWDFVIDLDQGFTAYEAFRSKYRILRDTKDMDFSRPVWLSWYNSNATSPLPIFLKVVEHLGVHSPNLLVYVLLNPGDLGDLEQLLWALESSWKSNLKSVTLNKLKHFIVANVSVKGTAEYLLGEYGSNCMTGVTIPTNLGSKLLPQQQVGSLQSYGLEIYGVLPINDNISLEKHLFPFLRGEQLSRNYSPFFSFLNWAYFCSHDVACSWTYVKL